MITTKLGIILGVDVGYQLVKTASLVMPNGVHAMGNYEPALSENTILWNGNYYKVGEGRIAIRDSMFMDDSARILTMMALAKELVPMGITQGEIILAVGLPFSEYGQSKQKLIEYYNKERVLNFEYEGIKYCIDIKKIYVFPQCYSAIAPRIHNMKTDYLIVDIGSKTTDVVFVQKGKPIESKSITIEKAMLKWIKEIQAILQVQMNKDIPVDEILKVFLGEPNYLPVKVVELIEEKVTNQIEELELELKERGFNLEYSDVVFVGGGAAIAKKYSRGYHSNYMYDTDITANAKGYEYLCKSIVERII